MFIAGLFILPFFFSRIYTLIMSKERYMGILIHPTSFYSPFAVGDLGDEAHAFIDIASENKIRLWQVLPLGPTGYGDSPYAPRSTFAGNELLIDLKALYLDGYLEIEDIMRDDDLSERVDYGKARNIKFPLLRKAAKTFLKSAKGNKGYQEFLKNEDWWLSDYALYQVLCDLYNDSRWFSSWPIELKNRIPSALEKVEKERKDEIEVWKVLQFFFRTQWLALKSYANEKGIKIIGDIPIFVAPDSVDAWTNRNLLKIDQDGNQEVSSGVPPDAFSATGQLWGNPLYRWSEHEKTGFAWWISRLRETLKLCDIVRIDHFRGLSACWEVPRGEETAINGKWVKSPGKELLNAAKEALGGDLPIIAEDLGVITDDVIALRDSFNLPGMKILQFAFSRNEDGELDADNLYLPHNIGPNSIVYTGTHDNNTSCGWYDELSDADKDLVRRYFECPDDQAIWQMIRHAMMTNAKYVVIPMQDLLMLGSDARMNTPSTCGSSNWSWRLKKGEISSPNWSRIHYLIKLYGRC